MSRVIKFSFFFFFVILSLLLDNAESVVALAFLFTFSLILSIVEDTLQTSIIIELKDIAQNYKICLKLEKDLYSTLISFHSLSIKYIFNFINISLPFILINFLSKICQVIICSNIHISLYKILNTNSLSSLLKKKLFIRFNQAVINTVALYILPVSYQQIRNTRINVLNDLRS